MDDFSEITEAPGQRATEEQLQRLYHRYKFAKQYVKDKDVLEIACGTGIGLSLLGEDAKSITGVEINEKNIETLMKLYGVNSKISVIQADAHELPINDDSYDVVVFLEAIYYLDNPKKFLHEANRVLRKNGIIIISTVNKEWMDFHPSKYSKKYYTHEELVDLLSEDFSDIEAYVAFNAINKTLPEKLFSYIKRIAVRLRIMPGKLSYRAILKRIFIGRLYPIPEKLIEGMFEYEQPKRLIKVNNIREWKIIYFVARKRGKG